MLRWCRFPSLYSMALNSLVRWTGFDIRNISELPGCIKDDFLRSALLRHKCHENITYFLHPDIQKLDISECNIRNDDLNKISVCSSLKILEMNPPKYSRFDHTTSILETMFSRLPNLLKLHTQRNDGMTDSVVSVITTYCTLLQVLDVSGCTKLTDGTALSIATLTNIRAINLSNTDISDVGLNALSAGQSSKSLVEIKLNNCIDISDKGVNDLVKGCRKLSILVFCNCPKVTVDCQLALDSFLNKDKKSKLITWTVYV